MLREINRVMIGFLSCFLILSTVLVGGGWGEDGNESWTILNPNIDPKPLDPLLVGYVFGFRTALFCVGRYLNEKIPPDQMDMFLDQCMGEKFQKNQEALKTFMKENNQ